MKPYSLFGDSRDSFAQTLILYHAVKAANDSQALAYTYNNETHGNGTPPPDKRGYYENYIAGLAADEDLAFDFYLPIRKGDHYSIKAELIDWDTDAVVGVHFNDLNPSGEQVVFKGEYRQSDPARAAKLVTVQFDDPNTNHGYCRMCIVGTEQPLQKILHHEFDVLDKNIKRYLLRIRTKIDPYDNNSADAYYREDSVIVVIQKQS